MATAPSSPAKRFGSYRYSRDAPIGFIQLGACKLHIRNVGPGKVPQKKKKQVQNAVCQVTERAVREEGLTLVGI